MFTAGAQVLESHVNLVNRLNVFPVQDGDTGINMLLTLRDTLAEARSAEGDAADAIAKAMWDGACMGAKGNGGSIVSQLFKGMSEAFHGKMLSVRTTLPQRSVSLEGMPIMPSAIRSKALC